MAAEGGVITFLTALDNDQLEEDLKDAEDKVEELKDKIEKSETDRNAIEEEMAKVQEALANASSAADELRERMAFLQSIEIDDVRWSAAQIEIESLTEKLAEAEALEDKLAQEDERLTQKWYEAANAVDSYKAELDSTEATASNLASQVSSTYYQAGKTVRETFEDMSTSVSRFADRVGNLVERTFVFSVITSALRDLKKGITEALEQNDAFSASWEYLGATMQGFANGIANVIAPALITIINAVVSCITMLAKAIDAVFKTGLTAAIGSARKAAEESWRQTDASKKAQKEADKTAKSRATQDEKYAKAQETYAERQEKAAERLSKAQEKAAKRQAKAEAKYPEAVEKAEKRQAKAEEKMAERLADKVEDTEKRRTKAEEKAAERLSKAQERAAERTAKNQERYDKRVAKAAEKAQKAQEKANQSILSFDEITKMSEDNADDYASALEDIEPPEVVEVDPSDYVIDPDDYAIDYDDYKINPEDFFVDPSDYEFDPMDYWVDPSEYALDPFDFDWKDYADVDVEGAMRPSWDALDTGKITEQVAALEAVLAGALLAVGAILAFSGVNIPLGLALMAAGALLYAQLIAEDWEKLPKEVQDAITGALVLSGIVLLVIGAILALSGANIPLGVGLMVAGALTEWGAVALNWESLSPEVQGAVSVIMGILSGALLVIGAVIAFGAIDPMYKAFGIGLMIVGAAGLAASVALNWESMDPELQGVLTRLLLLIGGMAIVIGVILLLAVPGQQALGIGLILSGVTLIGSAVALNWETLNDTLVPALQEVLDIIGKFAIVIGTVLLFVPGHRLLGLGLIVFGIAALEVSEQLLDWNSLDTPLSEKLGELVKVIAEAAVVIGVILLFIPTQRALGVGLIIFGIAAIGASEVAISWESLDGDLVGALTTLVDTVAKYAIIVGVILLFTPVRALGIGLIVFGIGALAVKEVVLNWDSMKEKLPEVLGTLVTVIAGFMLVIGVIMLISAAVTAGATLPIAVGLIIGGVAILEVKEAAVNWEDTKTHVGETIQDIFEVIGGFLVVLGILLCCTGVAIPMGIGMIVAGAGALAFSAFDVDWDFVLKKVKEIWEGVKEWWNTYIAPVFTLEWWEDKFNCIPEAIASAINAATEAFNTWFEGIQDSLAQVVGATGGTYNYASTVPSVRPVGLARGAVIPPNREFMAILGDQTRGNNIETPESLMRQVVREEAGQLVADAILSMQAMYDTQDGGGDVTLVLQVGHEELARAVSRGNASRARRGDLGMSLQFT